MKNFIYILGLLLTVSINAQLPGSGVSLQSNVLDGVYIQEHIPTKRVVQYTHLREADVMWSRKIWRESSCLPFKIFNSWKKRGLGSGFEKW